MARPLKTVDESRIVELASKGNSFKGIAIMLGISESTLNRRFKDACETGRELMRTSLLNKQYEVAMGDQKNKPNPIMLIWLGKQHLGQADKQDIDVRKTQTVNMVIGIAQNKLNALTGQQLKALPEVSDNSDSVVITQQNVAESVSDETHELSEKDDTVSYSTHYEALDAS